MRKRLTIVGRRDWSPRYKVIRILITTARMMMMIVAVTMMMMMDSVMVKVTVVVVEEDVDAMVMLCIFLRLVSTSTILRKSEEC